MYFLKGFEMSISLNTYIFDVNIHVVIGMISDISGLHAQTAADDRRGTGSNLWEP